MPFAYPYVRFSSDAQKDGNSLLRQTQAIQAYLRLNPQLTVDERFNLEDLGVSGYGGQHLERGGALHLFLQKIKKNEIEPGSVLIIEHFNRLSRLPLIKSISLFNEILSAGVNIAVLDENQTFTAESLTSIDYLKAVLRFELAHQESKDKSNKGIDNWRIKKERLRSADDPATARIAFTKTLPLWLKHEDGVIATVDEKLQTIILVFDLCVKQNFGFMKIARYLNEAQIPRLDDSSGPWTFDIVKRLVHNRALIGEYQPRVSVKKEGRKRLEYIPSDEPPIVGVYPAAVSESIFNQAQIKTRERKNSGGGRRADMPNLFIKLLRCQECGGSIKHQKNNNGYKEYRYLKCLNSLYGHCASPENRSWRYDEFEKMFFDYACKLNVDEIFSNVGYEASQIQEKILSIQMEKAKVEKRIEEITSQLVGAEAISQTMNKVLLKLEADLKNFDEQIKEQYQKISVIRPDNISGHKEYLRNSLALLEKSKSDVSIREKINSQLREMISRISINFRQRFAMTEFKSGVIRAIHPAGVFANLDPQASGEQIEQDYAEIEAWSTLSDEQKRQKAIDDDFVIVPLRII
jgi:hypothetical protein